MSRRKVCVVGAGVVGLSTAYCLLSEAGTQLHVEVLADRFSPHTTSDVAFGLWEPYLLKGTPLHKVKKWSQETISHVLKLANSDEASKAGSFVISGHSIYKEKPEDPSWKNEAIHFRHLTDKELQLQYPGFRYGWSWTSVASEGKFYLPYLMDKIRTLGGTFIKKKLSSLDELFGRYEVIVNCSGIGATHLTSDSALNAIKGQVIRVKAPWIKRFVMVDEMNIYVLPGRETVVLGGSHDEGDWNTDVCQETKARIFRDCCKILPSLRHAEFVQDCVGLRPGREEIRVEAEAVEFERNGKIREQKVEVFS